MKKFADEIKDCRHKLSKVKFIIPSEKYTRLNNIRTGKPIYFLPPLEGLFASLEGLPENINRPVIGLNITKEVQSLESIKEITKYFIDLLKTLEPEGNYDIFGYSYGALLVIKMMKKAPIHKAVVVDLLSDINLSEDLKSDENLMDTMLGFILKDMPAVIRAKLKRDIQSKPDVPSKLAKISEELREFGGKGLVSKDMDEILMNSYKRAKNIHLLSIEY